MNVSIHVSLLGKQHIGLTRPEYEGEPVKLVIGEYPYVDGTSLGEAKEAIKALRYALDVLESHV